MIVPAAEAEGFRDRLEQSEAIVRSIGDGVYVLDRGGRLVWINPAAEELLGWQSEELLGRSMHAVIHYRNAKGEQVAEKDCPLLAVLNSGRVLRVDFDVFIRRDGQDIPVTYTSSPVLRDSPELIQDYYKGLSDLGDAIIAMGDHRVQVLGDTAINTGYYTLTSHRNGTTAQLPARFTFVYQLRQGHWMIVAHHSSALP